MRNKKLKLQETLTIRNFGPIKDVTLDLRKVNVFIGDQGTGKSTVAKLLAALSEIHWNDISYDDLVKFSKKNQGELITDEERFKMNLIKSFEKYDIDGYLGETTYFKLYRNEDEFIEYKNNSINILPHSEEVYFKNSIINQLFIPANRESTNFIAEKYYEIIASKSTIPSLLSDFGQLLINAKKEQSSYNYSSTLNVEYQFENGIDKIVLDNGKKVPLVTTSSAIQSGIPLLVSFDNSFQRIINEEFFKNDFRFRKGSSFVFIEEPELNLFPVTQKKIVQYLIERIINDRINNKSPNYLSCLLITTHSPYILTSLNNLMYAYQVGQKHKDGVNGIIPEKYWVNPEDVRCYLMEDGEAKLIMDEEDGLIDATYIDSVSNDLNNEYLRINEVKLKDELGVS